MSAPEILAWFSTHLSRPAEAADLYSVAREFHQLGAHSRALACLRLYVGMPAAQVAGRHLLAYSFLATGDVEKALREFKKCVKEGYHDDWQMVVELTIEMEAKRREDAKLVADNSVTQVRPSVY
ncbi:hypothetical protein HDU86_002858 [Geranomyces michiganensis]|nr:hypothetical protein HDU86_002858 [Geranomyces michiganensis]